MPNSSSPNPPSSPGPPLNELLSLSTSSKSPRTVRRIFQQLQVQASHSTMRNKRACALSISRHDQGATENARTRSPRVTGSPMDDPACLALPAILADAAVLPPNTLATRLRTCSSSSRPPPPPVSCPLRSMTPSSATTPASCHTALRKNRRFLFGGTLALRRTSVYRFVGMLMRLRRRLRDHRSESPSFESRTGAVALGMRPPVRKWAIIFTRYAALSRSRDNDQRGRRSIL
ncbi:hypothetical protein FB451DRAFT_1178995 [Mycena latifolia]|nr:hypothetical protein FB451DRAFT_1178995 [Mycena latifolia]